MSLWRNPPFAGVTPPKEDQGLGIKWIWVDESIHILWSLTPFTATSSTNEMTFWMVYQYSEILFYHFHDEVVHGKYSLLWQDARRYVAKIANLRAYYGYMWGYPGKKIALMGNEFAQGRKIMKKVLTGSAWWKYWRRLATKAYVKLVKDLNQIYQKNRPLLSSTTPQRVSIGLSLMRANSCSPLNVVLQTENVLLSSVTLPPVPRHNYRIGVNVAGKYEEILNTDSMLRRFKRGQFWLCRKWKIESHGRENSISCPFRQQQFIWDWRRNNPNR